MHALNSILLFSTVCLTVCSAKEVGSKRVTKESKEKAIYPVEIDIFGFKNRDYFENPMAKIETIRERLHAENSDAILLGAPSFVPLDKTKKSPMASLRVTESRKAFEAPFQDFAILTVMDLGTNRLKANFFVEQKFVKIEGSTAKCVERV